jgi:N-acetylmuramoyl-L-alanine amidase
MPVPPAARPAGAPRVATIRDISRVVMREAVRVTIELDAEVQFRDERLDSPARVFLDLPSTRPAPALVDRTIRFESDADMVRQIRIGRHPNNTTRVVLDVNGIASYSVYALYDPYRLVVECVRLGDHAASPSPPPAVSQAQPLAARPLPPAVRRLAVPRSGQPSATALQQARVLEASPPLAATPIAPPSRSVVPPERASTNLAGGFSIARQLGLVISRIVIDPGHGGHDPGATGKGVTEAELVLDVALRLEQLLEAQPGTEVVLTRRTDEYVPLQDRTELANRVGADLFLSIHANASNNAQARGVETYFLNFATNRGAETVAARENAASGHAMAALQDLVKAIAMNNKLDESRDFAIFVQRAMIERLRGPNKGLRDLGVKQAPFVVLIGAAMPSVLAEISFVTNAQEARLLRSTSYRQRIAEALSNAIGTYQRSLKTPARRIAQQ